MDDRGIGLLELLIISVLFTVGMMWLDKERVDG